MSSIRRRQQPRWISNRNSFACLPQALPQTLPTGNDCDAGRNAGSTSPTGKLSNLSKGSGIALDKGPIQLIAKLLRIADGKLDRHTTGLGWVFYHQPRCTSCPRQYLIDGRKAVIQLTVQLPGQVAVIGDHRTCGEVGNEVHRAGASFQQSGSCAQQTGTKACQHADASATDTTVGQALEVGGIVQLALP